MAMDNAKHTGLVVALGMPPPGKLKKSMMGGKDEGESDAEAQNEDNSGKSGGGEMALKAMWDALKAGDMTAAWDAFSDAQDIAYSAEKKNPDEADEGEGGDKGSSDTYE